MTDVDRDEYFKLVVVGDGAAGKTTLLYVHVRKRFPEEYTPPVFDMDSVIDIECDDGWTRHIALCDTGGGEDYYVLRPLSYPDTDVYLLCFDITNRDSFEQLCSYWMPELDLNMPANTPGILVGCKADLRDPSENYPQIVSYQEAKQEAERLGMPYVETSSLRNKQVEECFKLALQLAIQHRREQQERQGAQRFDRLSLGPRKWNQIFKSLPPILPPKPLFPDVCAAPSLYRSDLKSAFETSLHHDVTFLLEDSSHRINAHRLVLCAATEFFAKLFITDELDMVGTAGTTPYVLMHDWCELAISKVYTEQQQQQQQMLMIVLQPDIKELYFNYVLRFCYTGNPGFPDDVTLYDLGRMIHMSEVFHLPDLELFCQNRISDKESLNPSLEDFHMESLGRRLKQDFLHNARFSDVTFEVNGKLIPAHKSVVCTRSEVLAAMLSGNFLEGSDSKEVTISEIDTNSFEVLLEYLYTDQLCVSRDKCEMILSLSDQYCLPHLLSRCEVSLTSETKKDVEARQKNYRAKVIHLHQLSKMYNAPQLEVWTLHAMAVNYSSFQAHDDFRSLEAEAKNHVKTHQWPPPGFQEAAEKHRRWLISEAHRYEDNRRKCTLL